MPAAIDAIGDKKNGRGVNPAEKRGRQEA